MESQGVAEDIADYVAQRLRCDHRFKKWAPNHGEIQKTLIERADGV